MKHPNTLSEAAASRQIGRFAASPSDIPRSGWRRILRRAWGQVAAKDLSLVAAGVAFYSLLALFPGIASLISIFGLIADPAAVESQFATMRGVLPTDVYRLLSEQMHQVASGSNGTLSAGLASAILLSVWSATRGTKSMMTALNIVYDETEQRGVLRVNLVAFAMTLFLVFLTVVVIALVVAVPVLLGLVGLGSLADQLVQWTRWPVLAALVLIALAIVYRYGPSRRLARWRWVSVGSVSAVGLWLMASALFSAYVSQLGTYNATYGSVGAVIVLLMWLYLSALITLLGAVINSEMERQTARDTTRGREQPRGQRGAYVADHLPDNEADTN